MYFSIFRSDGDNATEMSLQWHFAQVKGTAEEEVNDGKIFQLII